jgi:hypothetical protein
MCIAVDLDPLAPPTQRRCAPVADISGHPDLGRIGHESGRLVLHLERVLDLPAAQVRQALTASGRSGTARSETGGDAQERWDVDDERSGSRLAFTAWIDADDVETAAGTGARYHSCFDRLVRDIQQGTCSPQADDFDVALLSAAYVSAFAAALADTD